MPTMLYQPGIKAYISTAHNGLVEVSEDVNEFTMVRRSDGVSTFNFSLSNPQRKYDGVFTPNDRIIVSMKRLTWLRTFTGLLNSVPLMTTWPRVVSLRASCSLKRLQYWYWDSHAAATQQMIRDALSASVVDQTVSDGGITNVALTVLDKVVGWPSSKVHIARIPDDWFKIAYKVAQQVNARAEEADALAQQFQSALVANGQIGGATTGALLNGKLTPGQYAGSDLDAQQVANATAIANAARGVPGCTDRDTQIALMTSMQESSLVNLSHGDRDSLGLFQQRPSEGWGSAAQIMNPTYATQKFVSALVAVGNRTQMSEGQAAQTVQRSAYPDAYQKWWPLAQAVFKTLTGSTGGGLASDPRWQSANLAGGSPGASTGQAFAKTAAELVAKYPQIPYMEDPSVNVSLMPPPHLDCSSLVQWVLASTLGGVGSMPRTSQEQTAYCASTGGQRLTLQQALATPGALVFTAAADHVEISLGTGGQTVAARHTGTFAAVHSDTSWLSYGYTVPGLSYPGGIGAGNGLDPSQLGGDLQGTGADPSMASSLPGYNPNDPIDKLFGGQPWNPSSPADDAEMALSEGLTGIRALLNDQPLLPYLMNLFNSTMRSFCSAPNGDLIAWFPDYYGLWGTAAKMVVEPIEVQDFTVEWADDSFVTHQFTIAGQEGAVFLDVSSGSISDAGLATGSGADIRTQTLGIASIDIPAMMYALFGIDATAQEAQNFASYIYKRFGARPAYQEMPGLQGPKAEFFSAIFMFMRQWAYQYNADVPLTFMPELFPGMLLQIPAFDFQAYVTTVTHSGRFGQGGGFSTTVNIAAPARLPSSKKDHQNVLIGLPLAGGYDPGIPIGSVAAKDISSPLMGRNPDLLRNGKELVQ